MSLHPSGSPGLPANEAGLHRVLGFWSLALYGVSVIVGAGIYVAIGEVQARAGAASPVSFLVAGAAAALTGLSYADLASRWPHAAGAAAFVEHGFKSAVLGRVTAVALTVAVCVAAASIAAGSVKYFQVFIDAPPFAMILVLVAGFTLLAIAGVRESVGFAALFGLLEIGGLVAVIAAGLLKAPAYDLAALAPAGLVQWQGVASGAFIAFFAFIGFEVLANMGEETHDPTRTLPRAILAAVALSIVLYVGVSVATVWAGPQGAGNPLLGLFTGKAAFAFALVGALAIANGVLVEIIMLARLFYGMAARGLAPAFLGRVSPRTRTPVRATLVAGGLVLAVALFVPFERLLSIANLLTLAVFTMVNLAAVLVRADSSAPQARMRAPVWTAPLAALMTLALALSEIF
ncbi:MAG: amino acid permease [Beijerinckiaceae bacterium]|nr:amino acid permease [Beijerinckiaceae bacterium]